MMPAVLQSGFSYGLVFMLLSLVLAGCETDKIQQTKLGIQQNLFLQSLELIEKAGSILQKPDLEQSDIDTAMGQMDKGLQQAFQVNADFLRQLDPRLPRFYAGNFIAGVENYRLGVEASNRSRQLQGLDQLKQWSQFWLDEKPAILQKMAELTGLPTRQG